MADRTAVDVLLALERQVVQQGHQLRSLDLNIKVLSNKLNQVIDLINEVPGEDAFGTMDPSTNPAMIATAPPSRIQVQDEWKPAIPTTMETAPVGQRRLARPDTAGMPKPKAMPQQPAKNVPTPSFKVPELKAPTVILEQAPTTGKVPLSQRIVDRTGNSVFKADVEIQNAEGSTVWKGQTGTTGKWQWSLEPGKYHVSIRKQTTQQRFQAAQDLVVNDKTPRELPMMIIK